MRMDDGNTTDGWRKGRVCEGRRIDGGVLGNRMVKVRVHDKREAVVR